MQITIEHIPTQYTWAMSVKDLKSGVNKIYTLRDRDSTAGISFYSAKTSNHICLPAKIANECVFYLVSESEEEMQQMKEYFE